MALSLVKTEQNAMPGIYTLKFDEPGPRRKPLTLASHFKGSDPVIVETLEDGRILVYDFKEQRVIMQQGETITAADIAFLDEFNPDLSKRFSFYSNFYHRRLEPLWKELGEVIMHLNTQSKSELIFLAVVEAELRQRFGNWSPEFVQFLQKIYRKKNAVQFGALALAIKDFYKMNFVESAEVVE